MGPSSHVQNKASGLLRAEGVQQVGWGEGRRLSANLIAVMGAEGTEQAGVRFSPDVSARLSSQQV